MEKVELCINHGKKDATSEKDDDTKANPVTQAVPLRQRQLPSSFWEEPNRPQIRGDVLNGCNPSHYQEPVRNLLNKHSHPLFDRSNRMHFSYCCECRAKTDAGRDGHLCHGLHYPAQAFVPLVLDLYEGTGREQQGVISWGFNSWTRSQPYTQTFPARRVSTNTQRYHPFHNN
ncbi:hypothetical protein CHS0354_041624 [Potamilus streckersoni]|uniref:Uncharacterized protein n=1 Tax=Potamilus streckersoni TaxID=2493646 RepID=A0AAE0SGF8_9BIVA|nr:hypothetical protein CHS0354_041624 [Potamilus streckersoni]